VTLRRLMVVLAPLVLGTTPALAQGRRVTEGTLLWTASVESSWTPM
jgi:hypothetical protein